MPNRYGHMTKLVKNQNNCNLKPMEIEEQGRALLQAVPDLVFLLGLDGTYIDIFSAPDEDLFLAREELIGKTVLEVLPSPVGEDCMKAIGELQSHQDVSSFSYELLIDNNPRWFEGRVTLCDEDSVVILVRDFTEQRLAERNLHNANEALRRRARQLQRLEQELTRVEQRERKRMAQVIHDNLQQLLVGAKFNASIIARRTSDAEDRESAEDMIQLLDEAIQQSRLLTADLYHPILYEGAVTQSLEWIKNQASRLLGLDVDLSIFVSEDGLEWNDTIRFTLFSAIQELLLNVAKHAGVTKAEVIISTLKTDYIMVRVSDCGQGFISSTSLEEQGDEKGFGLFRMQERITWLGGELSIESCPGEGCTVVIIIPVKERNINYDQAYTASDTVAFSEELFVKPYNIRGKGSIRVLLVDDHEVLREGMARILLQDSSFSVVGEASDGETAVQLAALLKPDVILMDVMMPGIGGAEATRLIRKANPEIQVIALSIYEEHERGDEMRSAGAAVYLSKSRAALEIADAIRACYRK